MSFFAYTLFSGSDGNSFIISDEKTHILVDAGVSAKRTECALRALGLSTGEISAIFVTHEHIDHTKGLEIISKYHSIPVHMTVGTARAAIKKADSPILPCLYAHKSNFSVKLGDITVRSFSTPHDAAQSVGYTFDNGSVKIGFATDTGYITEEMLKNLVGCRAAVIEANHDEQMLMSGTYPYQLKMRIMSNYGHLSNEKAAKLAAILKENGTSSLLLAHLSKENNTRSLALSEVRSAVGDAFCLNVAATDIPTELKIV